MCFFIFEKRCFLVNNLRIIAFVNIPSEKTPVELRRIQVEKITLLYPGGVGYISAASANAIIEMQVYTNGCDIVSFGSSLVESYPITHRGGIGLQSDSFCQSA